MDPSVWRILVFALGALLDCVYGLLLALFCIPAAAEVVQISHVDTDKNRSLVSAMDKLDTWRSFVPSPWARTSRAQSVFADSNKTVPSYNRSEQVQMQDGVNILLEWKDSSELPPNAPIIVCLHGVAGSGKSKVVVQTCDAVLLRGWRGVVYTRRGHGDSSLLSSKAISVSVTEEEFAPVEVTDVELQPLTDASALHPKIQKVFPSHADMEDMSMVMQHIRSSFPMAPMFLVGFSVGSNAAVKYLGEHCHTSPFVGGISVCNGLDLVRLTKGFTPTANALMTKAIRGLISRKLPEIRQLAEARGIKIDWKIVMNTTSVRELESALMLPIYTQFATLDEFLEGNSSGKALQEVSVPLLCMTAMDDPLIPRDIPSIALEASKGNPHVICLATERGGHLGWLTGWKGESWGMTVIMQFMETVLAQAEPVVPPCEAL